MDLPVDSCPKTNIRAGGILSRRQNDICGLADYYRNADSDKALLALCLRRKSNLIDHLVKGRSGIILAEPDFSDALIFPALSTFDGPAFLLTQKQWRLFVGNPHRGSVLTFPSSSQLQTFVLASAGLDPDAPHGNHDAQRLNGLHPGRAYPSVILDVPTRRHFWVQSDTIGFNLLATMLPKYLRIVTKYI